MIAPKSQVPAMKKSRIRGEGSVAAKLEADVVNAGLSKRLATVSTEAPIETTVDALRYRGPNDEALQKLFARLGFETLLQRIRG